MEYIHVCTTFTLHHDLVSIATHILACKFVCMMHVLVFGKVMILTIAKIYLSLSVFLSVCIYHVLLSKRALECELGRSQGLISEDTMRADSLDMFKDILLVNWASQRLDC